MSRRTKLILTALALFVVLGFVLATHWGARDPLQFRVERVVWEGNDLVAHGKVTNTSDIPVYLFVGVWRKPNPGRSQMESVGYLVPRNQPNPSHGKPWVYLEPGATISCTVAISQYADSNDLYRQAEMVYYWRSGLGELVWDCWEKLTKNAPKPIQKLLSENIGIFIHHAPIDPPREDVPGTATKEPVPISR